MTPRTQRRGRARGIKMPKTKESCLERLLMSRLFRRYVECLIVVFFPLVLLTEQEAEELMGDDRDVTKF